MSSNSLPTFFSRFWLFIVIVSLVAAGAAYLLTKNKKATFIGSLSVTVSGTTAESENTQYILQPNAVADTSVRVATVQGWVSDPVVVQNTLQSAGIDTSEISVNELITTFELADTLPNSAVFQVLYTNADENEVSSVLNALAGQLSAEELQYNSLENSSSLLSVQASNPVVSKDTSGQPLVPLAGLLAGFILACAVAAATDRNRA